MYSDIIAHFTVHLVIEFHPFFSGKFGKQSLEDTRVGVRFIC